MSPLKPVQKSSREHPTPVPADSMVATMNLNRTHYDPPGPAPELQPRIRGNYIENGREYHGFRKEKYMFPCDELEMDRMDIYHKFFSVARGADILHSAPLSSPVHKLRILDVGTGTGIWAIDMQDKYEQSEVVGIDITLMQPASIPRNLRFEQMDFDSPWYGLGLDSFDLIHMRMLCGSVSSWPDMYQKAFSHLKPGIGYLEHVEIDMYPRCRDNTIPENSQLMNWMHYIMDATAAFYRPLAYNPATRQMLADRGFVDIEEQVIEIPFNPWDKHPRAREIGSWYNLGLTQGLEALTLAPMTRIRGWKKSDVDHIVQDAKREICSRKIHAFCTLHIWTARRP